MVTKEFNVITYDFNNKSFETYNIIPYLLSCYEKLENKPITFSEFKKFIIDEACYQWWSRCEYEIILCPWPYTLAPNESRKENENDVEAWKEHWDKHLKECEKIDVYDQVKMNIDVITNLVMEIVNE